MQSRLYVEAILASMKHFDVNSLQVDVWRWFLRSGREFSTINREHSRNLANHYGAHERQCYANALQIAMCEPELAYVEGFATSIIPVEHAWVVNKQGTVFDPTWILLGEDWTPDYFGVEIPLIVAAKHYADPRLIMPAWTALAQQQLNKTFISGESAGQTDVA